MKEIEDSVDTLRKPLWLILTAVSLPMFMAALDNLVVTSALPVIREKLDASVSDLQWFVNAYTLSFASLILMAVACGDRFGRRRLFLGGVSLFTLASMLCAISTSPQMLIMFRALQGVGAAAIMPLSLSLLTASAPVHMRTAAIGIWGGVSGLGVAVDPLVGGAVVEGLEWSSIFWINVPIGVLSVVLALTVIQESFGPRARIDALGLPFAVVGVFGVVFGIVNGNDRGWSDAAVLWGLIGGGICLIVFTVVEIAQGEPLLPTRLFRDRSFTVANMVGLIFSFGIFGAIFILIQFLQIVQAHTPLEAGVMTLPWTMAPLFISPLAGVVTNRTGTRILLVSGLAAMSAGLAWIALVIDPTVRYTSLVPGFLLCGIGMGLVFAPSSSAVVANLAEADHAKASGTNSTVRELGVAVGVATLTSVFTSHGGQFDPIHYTDAAIPSFWVGVLSLVIATVVALFMPSRRTELGKVSVSE